MRTKFKKGEQRNFLDLVIERLNCVSLKGILQFGLNTSYDCLKNYYTERRLLPENIFDDLCYLAKINRNDLGIIYLNDNWGQVRGGNLKRKNS